MAQPRDRSEMRFLEHLEELRWRIIWALTAAVLAIGLGFFFVLRFNVIALLEGPILPYLHGHHVVATRPTDGLQLTITASIWIGVVRRCHTDDRAGDPALCTLRIVGARGAPDLAAA